MKLIRFLGLLFAIFAALVAGCCGFSQKGGVYSSSKSVGLALTPQTIKVATWNLCCGRGKNDNPIPVFASEKRDQRLEVALELLKRENPDILILNEVSFSSLFVGGENQAKYFSEKLDLPWRVEQNNGNVSFCGVRHRWGNAILSFSDPIPSNSPDP